MKYKEMNCDSPLCNEKATVLVVYNPDAPDEKEGPGMCFDCARARKKTAKQYGHEVLITTLD